METWLPVDPNYSQGVNVADQLNQPHSLLNFYKKFLGVRKGTPALIEGEYQSLYTAGDEYIAFLRKSPQQKCLVVLNFSEKPQMVVYKSTSTRGKVLFSSAERVDELNLSKINVEPFEILIVEL